MQHDWALSRDQRVRCCLIATIEWIPIAIDQWHAFSDISAASIMRLTGKVLPCDPGDVDTAVTDAALLSLHAFAPRHTHHAGAAACR